MNHDEIVKRLSVKNIFFKRHINITVFRLKKNEVLIPVVSKKNVNK